MSNPRSRKNQFKQLAELAHEIAFDDSVSTVDAQSILVVDQGETWHDTSPSPNEIEGERTYVDRALRYLDLRGALVRHPEQANWVQIGCRNHESGVIVMRIGALKLFEKTVIGGEVSC